MQTIICSEIVRFKVIIIHTNGRKQGKMMKAPDIYTNNNNFKTQQYYHAKTKNKRTAPNHNR